MIQKKIVMLACLVTLLSGDIRAVMPCVTIEPGSNMWRLVANVGTCLNTFTPVVLSDLDTILSVVDDIQEDLLSVSDVLGSKIMKVDTDLLSISDVIISDIEHIIISEIEGVTSLLEDLHEDLYSESDIIQSKIMKVDADVLSVGDVLTSQLDIIETTDTCVFGTAITAAHLPITLNTPGLYRLCGDINFTSGTTAAITITSSDVVLDLNSYNLNMTVPTNSPAISLASGVNVIIRNGTINMNTGGFGIRGTPGQFCNANISNIIIEGVGGTLSRGILISNSTDFIIENCQINNVDIGIAITGSSQFTIKGCMVTNTGGVGITISSGAFVSTGYQLIQNTVFDAGLAAFVLATVPANTYIKDCSAFSSEFGFSINSGNGIVFEDCVSCANQFDGFHLSASNIIVERCIATENGNDGFTAQSGTNVIIKDCTSNTNTRYGFFGTSTNVLMEGCVALHNGNDGFIVGTATTSLRECSATTNGGMGFNLNTAAGIVLKDCFASQNVSSGISDGGLAQFILDTRSVNNGAPDVVGSSTVITY